MLPTHRLAIVDEGARDELGESFDVFGRFGQPVEMLASTDRPADRFTIAAAILRHLVKDPLLPEELLPSPSPAPALRRAYDDYTREFAALLAAAPF